LIKRLRNIHSELSLLGAEGEVLAPIYESESSAATASLFDSGVKQCVTKGLKHSLKCELDGIVVCLRNDLESRRKALVLAISEVQHRLSESKGQKRTPLQDTLMQLRSQQRLLKYETDACESMQKQLLLACRSRYDRQLKFYKDIGAFDEKSAHLISSRWIPSTAHASSVALERGSSGPTGNRLDSNEQHHLEAKKTHLAASIEQWSIAAIAATTPRGYRPNEQAEFTNGN
jgi:hypothetical protein